MIWPGLRPLISPLQCVRVQWYWVVDGVRDVVVSIGINVEACKNRRNSMRLYLILPSIKFNPRYLKSCASITESCNVIHELV